MEHEQRLYRFLVGYRFFAFALAVILIQVVPGPEALDQQEYLILSLVGAYTLLKVFSPVRWNEAAGLTYLVLWGDLAVAVALVLFTQGIDSGYLMYSLAPVITASLLMGFRVAIAVAAVTVVAPFFAHGFVSQFTDDYAWLLQGNRLPVLLLYSGLAGLLPIMANRTNLNIRRFIAIDAVLQERRYIRREMHDGVAQVLNYLNLRASAISKALRANEVAKADAGIQDIREVVRSTYEDLREFLDRLTDEPVARPLIPTLASYAREYSERYGIRVDLQAPDALKTLTPLAELQLLRIAQESLTNVRKHAQASSALIRLMETPGGAEMWVKDDGRGLSVADGPPGDLRRHHGLAIMQERAQTVGGTLEIRSDSGKGTEVHVVIPRQKVRL